MRGTLINTDTIVSYPHYQLDLIQTINNEYEVTTIAAPTHFTFRDEICTHYIDLVGFAIEYLHEVSTRTVNSNIVRTRVF